MANPFVAEAVHREPTARGGTPIILYSLEEAIESWVHKEDDTDNARKVRRREKQVALLR